ncbi:MAG: hypothetical protein D6785_09070, partial [Planctomycetota bacterium]
KHNRSLGLLKVKPNKKKPLSRRIQNLKKKSTFPSSRVPNKVSKNSSKKVSPLGKMDSSKKKSTIISQLSKASKEKKDQLQMYQYDLDRANRIQFNLLPDKIPKVPGLDIRVHYQSSKEVGGDYYDFINVDSEHLGIVVADVSGKGVPAAMVMAMTRSFLRLLAKRNPSPKHTIMRLNKYLARDIRGIMFVTMVYMILNIRTREMTLVNAGHNPLLLKTSSTLQIINPPGMAIGLDGGDIFNNMLQEERVVLQKGDRVLAYTDGITESMNEKEEEFGEEPLVEILQTHYTKSSQQFLNLLMEAVQKHQGEAEQHDDITVLSFRYTK